MRRASVVSIAGHAPSTAAAHSQLAGHIMSVWLILRQPKHNKCRCQPVSADCSFLGTRNKYAVIPCMQGKHAHHLCCMPSAWYIRRGMLRLLTFEYGCLPAGHDGHDGHQLPRCLHRLQAARHRITPVNKEGHKRHGQSSGGILPSKQDYPIRYDVFTHGVMVAVYLLAHHTASA